MSSAADTKDPTICCYCRKEEKGLPATMAMCGHNIHIRCIPCAKEVPKAEAKASSASAAAASKPTTWYSDSVCDTTLAHTTGHLMGIRQKLAGDTRRVQYKFGLATVKTAPDASDDTLPPELDEGSASGRLNRSIASGRNRASD